MALKIEQTTREAIDRARDFRLRKIYKALDEILLFHGEIALSQGRCESEIEWVFLVAWIQKLSEHGVLGFDGDGEWGWEIDPEKLPTNLSVLSGMRRIDVIFTQREVVGFRPDFILQRGKRGWQEGEELQWSVPVIVECDGHEFHEKTKEQAKRDKMRDRAFQLAGYKVLHFTGSEIWKDASECADEVNVLLNQSTHHIDSEKCGVA